jgi:hypothetical protein
LATTVLRSRLVHRNGATACLEESIHSAELGIRYFFLYSLFRYFINSFRYRYSATFLNISVRYSLSLLLLNQSCGPHHFEGLYRRETDLDPDPEPYPDPQHCRSTMQFFTTDGKKILDNILIRDAPDIRPDNPAFFDIRYPAGYRIALPDIRLRFS